MFEWMGNFFFYFHSIGTYKIKLHANQECFQGPSLGGDKVKSYEYLNNDKIHCMAKIVCCEANH